MAEPTDEQLQEYAERLPEIYVSVLSAFPGKEPERRFGDGSLVEDIELFVSRQLVGSRFGDVEGALSKLVDRGFLRMPGVGVVFPTPLGERLITVLTGHVPKPAGIPELPIPTWG